MTSAGDVENVPVRAVAALAVRRQTSAPIAGSLHKDIANAPRRASVTAAQERRVTHAKRAMANGAIGDSVSPLVISSAMIKPITGPS